MTNTALASYYKGLATTLSLANLKFAGNGAVSTSVFYNDLVRSEDWKSSGKYYFEATVNATGGTNAQSFGSLGIIGSMGYGYQAASGHSNAAGMIISSDSPNVFANGTIRTSIVTGGTGLYCFAVDLDNKNFWLRKGGTGNWNGSGTANPATNTGGFSISNINLPVSPYGTTDRNTVAAATFNFGDTAYTGTAPSGFGNWTTNSFTPTTQADLWNTSDKGSFTLSSTSGGSSDWLTGNAIAASIARTVASKTTGKWYWEIIINDGDAANLHQYIVGACLASATSANMLAGNGLNGFGLQSQGTMYINGTAQSGTLNDTQMQGGAVVQFAMDLDNDLAWIRVKSVVPGTANNGWNGSATADPATGTGGKSISFRSGAALFPCVAIGATGGIGSFILNTGQHPFAGDGVPTGGFSIWNGGATNGTTTGVTLTDAATLISGSATPSVAAPGTTLTDAASLQSTGTATGGASAGGVTLTDAVSLTAGQGTAGATAAGATLADAASLTVEGSATGSANASGDSLIDAASLADEGTASGSFETGAELLSEPASLMEGTATGDANASGENLIDAASLATEGSASGSFETAAELLTADASLISGLASSGDVENADVTGVELEATAEIIAGTATGSHPSVFHPRGAFPIDRRPRVRTKSVRLDANVTLIAGEAKGGKSGKFLGDLMILNVTMVPGRASADGNAYGDHIESGMQFELGGATGTDMVTPFNNFLLMTS